MNRVFKLSVFNTITRRYEEIEVTEEIYREYKRTEWAIENDDRSFREHQISFSCLIGGESNNYETFDEFVRASIEVADEPAEAKAIFSFSVSVNVHAPTL